MNSKHDKSEQNPLANSRPLDIHRWSDAPEVLAATESIFSEMQALVNFSGNRKKTKANLSVALLDLLERFEEDSAGYIGISRSPNSYTTDARYNRLSVTFRPFDRVVDCLEALGYIEVVPGFNDRRPGGQSFISRTRATHKLIFVLKSGFGVSPAMIGKAPNTEVIILRDRNKRDIAYADTPRTIEMRELVREYNLQLSRTYVDVISKGYSGPYPKRIDLNNKFVRRIFNNSSWDEGGRFYGGWWQELPKGLRQRITIQGKPTTEIDYSGIHIVILYALEGVDYFGTGNDDPYEIGGFASGGKYRALFKQILLIALNSKDKAAAKNAVQWEINKAPDSYPSGVNIGEAIDAFEAKHALIAKYFYSVAGRKLMYLDSLFAEKIVQNFVRGIGVPPLVIHDSFIVRKMLEEELEDLMKKVLDDVLKSLNNGLLKVTPKLKTSKWSIYEQDPESDGVSQVSAEGMRRYFESDLYDEEQETRRKEWNATGRQSPLVFVQSSGSDKSADTGPLVSRA